MKILPIIFFIFCFNSLLITAELDIICTTDLHGNFNCMPGIAALFRSVGSQALKIDAGDTLTGTFYSELKSGKNMIELMNRLKYDVWVPGNHDFETGYSHLAARIREFRGTVLGAQWHWNGIRPVKWKLFERSGVRAAVIGLTDPAMPVRILPGCDGHFSDGHKALKQIMPEILAARPHVIILVYHNGEYSRFGNTYMLSRSFPEIDIILGGHSHQEIPGKRLGHAWFVQAGAHGSKAAVVKVTVDDKTGRIRKITSGLYSPSAENKEHELKRLCRKMTAEQRRASAVPLVSSGRKIVISRQAAGQALAEQMLKMTSGDAAIVRRPQSKFRKSRKHPFKNTLITVGTAGDVRQLFPYNNRICLITVFREDLEELAQACRENSRKRKVDFFFSGDISADNQGRLSMKKESVVLAVSDFVLVSTPVLYRKLQQKKLWKVIPGLTERQIAAEMFRSRILTAQTAGAVPQQQEHR